jgi:hypothetical protein
MLLWFLKLNFFWIYEHLGKSKRNGEIHSEKQPETKKSKIRNDDHSSTRSLFTKDVLALGTVKKKGFPFCIAQGERVQILSCLKVKINEHPLN